MTPSARRRRTIGQALLLGAAFLVLFGISTASIWLVNKARIDSNLVVHTVENENQIATLLLEIRRAESAARGFLLTSGEHFEEEYRARISFIPTALDELAAATADNPVQKEKLGELRPIVEQRLAEFKAAIDDHKAGNREAVEKVLSAARPAPSKTVERIRVIAAEMHLEEERLLALRTKNADFYQSLSSWVTALGSALVLLLGLVSVALVRRSARGRDAAEAALKDTNANLENLVDERTADLTEANEEIQRFAYIVSHDLRSPLVNIMGFTSELEELRGDIFRRIATLSGPADKPIDAAEVSEDVASALQGDDRRLADEFTEALGFIKSSIGKMDRLISAILNLTREGRREFKPERIDTTKLIETIAETVAHQAQEAQATIKVEKLPELLSDRLALEQIFGNLIDNALKYLRDGVPGEIIVSGKTKLGFAVFEVTDNGRGIDPKDHQRIFDLFRRAGVQDRPGQGIGLAHVRALIRRLGGTMSVNSALDAGSTFTVTLPVKWTGANRDAKA